LAKLNGGHQAAVTCLAVGRISEDEDVVITGSRDHYIKVSVYKVFACLFSGLDANVCANALAPAQVRVGNTSNIAVFVLPTSELAGVLYT